MSWHLEKKVTVGVILALVVNSGAIVWGAAMLTSRVEQLQTVPARVTELEKEVIQLLAREQLRNQMMRDAFRDFQTTLTTFNNTLTRIDRTQAGRKPVVNKVAQDMGIGGVE